MISTTLIHAHLEVKIILLNKYFIFDLAKLGTPMIQSDASVLPKIAEKLMLIMLCEGISEKARIDTIVHLLV